MKKLNAIIIIALIGVCLNTSAQDIIDPPSLDNVDTSTVLINRDNLPFIKGWNWG